MKLGFKISVMITTLVVTVLSISQYISSVDKTQIMKKQYEEDGKLILEATHKVLASSVWEVNPQGVDSGIGPFFRDSNLLSVEVFNEKEMFFAGLKREKLGLKKVAMSKGLTKIKELSFNNFDLEKNTIEERVNIVQENSVLKIYAKLTKQAGGMDKPEIVGTVVVRYSTEKLSQLLNTAFMNALFLTLFMLICVVGPILLYLQYRVLKPLAIVSNASKEVANGKIEKVGHTDIKDELGILQRSFNNMVDGIVLNMENQAKQSRMEAELQTTKLVQETLIPKEASGNIGHFKYASHFQSADECGGDWFGFNLVGKNKDKLLVLLGDVTGHGTPSAFVTAVVKGYCDSLKLRPDEDITPQKVLSELDEQVKSCSNQKRMMTMFAAVIDKNLNKLTFANAGHNHPYIRRGVEGIRALKKNMKTLVSSGKRLGYLDASSDHGPECYFKEKTVDFYPGDVLFVFSDGLIENTDVKGNEFSDKRLRALLKNAEQPSVESIIEDIKVTSNDFFNKSKAADDVTYLAIQGQDTKKAA